MAYNVKFLKGTAAQYNNSTKDANSFYYIDNADLYLGSIKLSNAADLATAIVRIAANETAIGDIATLTTNQKANLVAAVNELKTEIFALTGGESGSISDMIADAIKGVTDTIGEVPEGKTVVQLIAEAKQAAIDAATYDDTAIRASINANTNAITILNGDKTREGSVAKQVADAVAAIVAEAPEAYDTLKEISDWISSHASDASAMNTQIVTNKNDIKALNDLVGELPEGTDATTIVEYINKSIEAADSTNAIATALQSAKDYADSLAGNYATAAQGAKADTAVQSVVEGTANGTIKVDGTDVNVHGLKSAAYAETTDFDAAGSATTAENNAKAYCDTALTWKTME